MTEAEEIIQGMLNNQKFMDFWSTENDEGGDLIKQLEAYNAFMAGYIVGMEKATQILKDGG